MHFFKWLMRVVAWAVIPTLLWACAWEFFGGPGLGVGVLFFGLPLVVMGGLSSLFPSYAVHWDPVGAPLFWALGFLAQGLVLERVGWAFLSSVRTWRHARSSSP